MIEVVGVAAHGLPAPGTPERLVIDRAEVLMGGARQLALVSADHPAQRRPWPSPLRQGLPAFVAEVADRRVVVLASGDPLLSGVGTTLIELLGAAAVRIHPAVSSVALARARLGWSAETSAVVSLVGREMSRLRRELHPQARLIVLLSGSESIGDAAGVVTQEGYGHSTLRALADLGAPTETTVLGTARTWADAPPLGLPRLCLLAVDARLDPDGTPRSTAAGLPDDAFEHDGQITKRHLRASALAHLAPTPGAMLWDVGAGAGSISVEWARHHPRNRVAAIEACPDRADRIGRNADRLGVAAQVRVARGDAADVLTDLVATGERPDAVFVGGGASEDVLTTAYDALASGGRFVVHGVTAETEALLVASYRRWGGDLTRTAVETAQPLGTYLGWAPARTVVQWAAIKPNEVEKP